LNGLFITFEGVEGAGKTSVLQYVYDELKQDYDVIKTREPGGINISEKIRAIILDKKHTEMDARTEALLYAAARRQHLVERIIPALDEGKIVLCDRFIDSSLAYQGYAREIGVEEVYSINKFAIDSFMPHLTIIFNLDPEIGLKRITQNEEREQNRLDLEKLPFHKKVAEAYDMLAERFSDRIQLIDANQSLDQVKKQCLQIVQDFIKR